MYDRSGTTLNGSKSYRGCLIIMLTSPYISEAEFASLAVVGTGVSHGPISVEHAKHLQDLRLIYNLLGSLRMTSAGKKMLRAVN